MKKKTRAKTSGRVEVAVADLRGLVESMLPEFVAIKRQFEAIGQQFEAVGQQFETIGQQFEVVGQRFDAVDQRFDAVDQRFDAVDQRFDAVDQRFDAVDREFALVRQEIRDGDEAVKSHCTQLIDSVRDDVRIFAEAHIAVEQRVTALEKRRR